MNNVTVKVVKRFGPFKVGRTMSVQPNVASLWIRSGLVERVGEQPARECAAIEHDGETAMMPNPKPKRKYVRRRNHKSN